MVFVDNESRPVKTTQTSFRIIREIKRRGGATHTELADHLDLAMSTLHNHLATLREEGFLVKRGRHYHISLEFLDFGEHARNQRDAYRPAIDQANRLAERTNEEANFSVVENGYMYPIEYALGNSQPESPSIGSEFLKIGNKFHMHHSASGKAVLAELPHDEVERIVEHHGLPATTENTITEPETLYEELADVRDRGYSTNDEELREGFRSVAAPVSLDDGTIIGGIAVGGPAYRFELSSPAVDRIVGYLHETVERAEAKIAELSET